MNKTKIDWCDSTWNPVTGCLHGCEYCYARGIAARFGGNALSINHELDKPFIAKERTQPYPFGFVPTFHRYRLNDYIGKKGRNIFVCSMADLFGDWVPDSWIEEVFKACEKAPQHNYLFLTKNPKRYDELYEKLLGRYIPDSMWYGSTVTKTEDIKRCFISNEHNTFWSIEPIHEPLQYREFINATKDEFSPDWIIIGAETGRRKERIIPKKEWIEDIVKWCDETGVPVFMKSSLTEIWGEPLIQEFPEKLEKIEKVCKSVSKKYYSMAIEIQQYRSIGTVEECREAMKIKQCVAAIAGTIPHDAS